MTLHTASETYSNGGIFKTGTQTIRHNHSCDTDKAKVQLHAVTYKTETTTWIRGYENDGDTIQALVAKISLAILLGSLRTLLLGNVGGNFEEPISPGSQFEG